MFQAVSKVISAIFSKKSEEFKSSYQSCADSYYKKTDTGSFNTAWLRKLSWTALATGGLLVQSGIGLPVGVAMILATVFVSTMLMMMFATIRKFQGYNAFVAENKKAIALIDKAIHLQSSIQIIKNRIEALELLGPTDYMGPRYKALKKILSSCERPIILSGDLRTDARLAKSRYQTVWDLVRITSLNTQEKLLDLRQAIPKDYPHRQEIVAIFDKVPLEKHYLLAEGFFSSKEQVCFDTGLSIEDLKNLEQWMGEREEGVFAEVSAFWAQIYSGQEPLPLDVMMLEKILYDLDQQKLEQYFEGETLGKKEQDVLDDMEAESLVGKLENMRNEIVAKIIPLARKRETTEEEKIQYQYLADVLDEVNNAYGEAEAYKTIPVQSIRKLTEEVARLNKAIKCDSLPESYRESYNSREQYSKIKNVLRGYVSTLKDKKTPKSMQKVTKILKQAAQAEDAKACQSIISNNYGYEEFSVDKKKVSSKVAAKYVPKVNKKWELFCQSMQGSNIISPRWAESCIESLETFRKVFSYLRDNEVAFASRVVVRNKPEIKGGIAKIDELLKVIDRQNIKQSSFATSVQAKDLDLQTTACKAYQQSHIIVEQPSPDNTVVPKKQ